MFFEHSLDVQIFHTDDIVIPDYRSRQLLEVVLPLVAQFFMGDSESQTSFLPVLATFLFARDGALKMLDLLLGLLQKLLVLVFSSVG